MKFLHISGVHYQKAIESIYDQTPFLKEQTYQHQQAAFFSRFIGYGNSLVESLAQFGYETYSILYDVKPLQIQWALEQKIDVDEQNWQEQIVFKQIETIRPDILFFQDILVFSPSIFAGLKKNFSFLKKVIIFRGYPESHQTLLNVLRTADLVLVGSPTMQYTCTRQNIPSFLFYHYFDPRVLNACSLGVKKFPLTFLGTSGFGYGWNHWKRYALLQSLLESENLICWLDEPVLKKNPSRLFQSLKVAGETVSSLLPEKILKSWYENHEWPNWVQKNAFNALARKKSGHQKLFTQRLQDQFPEKCYPGLFGIPMYQQLAFSDMTLNQHTFAAFHTVDNIRLFQATGMKTCLVTDDGVNLKDLFIPDEEVIAFSSIEECREKLQFLYSRPVFRDSIATKGHQRTLRDHTAVQRAVQLIDHMKHKGK